MALSFLATAGLSGAPQSIESDLEPEGPQVIERSVELQPGDVSLTIEIEAPRKVRPPDSLLIELPAKTLTATVRTPDGQTLDEASAAPGRYTWDDLFDVPNAGLYRKNPGQQRIFITFFDFFPAGVYRIEIRGRMDKAGTAKAEFDVMGDLEGLHAEILREATCFIFHKPFHIAPGVRDRVLNFVLKEDEGLAIFDLLIFIPNVSRPNVAVRLERPDGTFLDGNSPAKAGEQLAWIKAPIAYDVSGDGFSSNPEWLLLPQEGMHAIFFLKTAPKGRYRIHIGTRGAPGRATVRALFIPVARLFGDRCPERSELAELEREKKKKGRK